MMKTDQTDAGRRKHPRLLEEVGAAAAKLGSRRGESIAESLLSILIAALGVVAFVTLLTSAARIIQKSGSAMDTYFTAMTAMEQNIAGTNSKNAGEDATAKLSLNLFGTTEMDRQAGIPVKLYEADGSTSMQVYAYSRATDTKSN